MIPQPSTLTLYAGTPAFAEFELYPVPAEDNIPSAEECDEIADAVRDEVYTIRPTRKCKAVQPSVSEIVSIATRGRIAALEAELAQAHADLAELRADYASVRVEQRRLLSGLATKLATLVYRINSLPADRAGRPGVETCPQCDAWPVSTDARSKRGSVCLGCSEAVGACKATCRTKDAHA